MRFDKKGTQVVAVQDSVPIAGGGAQADAFGRLRVSDPVTLFDSKQLHDNQPLFWDDQEVSGSGTSSSHSTAKAQTTISVGATTAGKRVRQTFQRWNYQPGKSQLFFMTGRLSAAPSGITAAMGAFDDDNGVFVKAEDGVLSFVVRSSASGSPVDTEVTQANWNGDKMDGTGDSGYTLDPTKCQIFWMDWEWLGVGRLKCGFVGTAGELIECHRFKHANVVSNVYMSTPNVPLRYSIENDGTGAATSLDHICSTVISEGGVQDNGTLRYHSTQGTHLDLSSANTLYPVLGIRLKSTALDGVVQMVEMSMINQQSQDWEWALVINPTLSGAASFSDQTNSVVQTHTGDGSISVSSGGTYITGGFVASGARGASAAAQLQNALKLGSAIDGTPDEIYLCARPLSANADIEASLTWRELS